MPPKNKRKRQPQIYRLRADIRIDDRQNSEFNELMRKFSRDMNGELAQLGFIYFPNQFSEEQYGKFQDIVAFVIRAVASRYSMNAFCSEFRYRSGSLIAALVLFLETGVFYSHLKEATEKISEDLEDIFSIRGRYSVQVDLQFEEIEDGPTENVQSRSEYPNRLGMATSIVIIFCFLGAAFFFIKSSKEEHFSFPEKIEIVVKQESVQTKDKASQDSAARIGRFKN